MPQLDLNILQSSVTLVGDFFLYLGHIIKVNSTCQQTLMMEIKSANENWLPITVVDSLEIQHRQMWKLDNA